MSDLLPSEVAVEAAGPSESAPPALPAEVVRKTREKYIEAYERLSQQAFPWK